MITEEIQPIYTDRTDAGIQLAERLAKSHYTRVVICAVPRGGVPVAIEIADRLGAPLDLVVVRKIPIPGETEAGFGAITEDGATVLNEPLVRRLGLTPGEIERQSQEVRVEIERRSRVFRKVLPARSLQWKTVILVDDGLASGYTMIAAIKSLRQRHADKVVAAVPAASESAYNMVKLFADEVVCPAVSKARSFAVAGFYQNWYDLTDEDVFNYLNEWKKRQS